MTASSTKSPLLTLTLTEEERAQLASLLEQTIRDTLVEAHRTDSPDYREHIQRREAVLRSVSEKLSRP